MAQARQAAPAADDEKLESRYVLVTGASSGIGESCCREIINTNEKNKEKKFRYVVIGTGRKKEKLDALATELNKGCPKDAPNFISFVFDLADTDKLEKDFWKEVEKHTKFFHVIINNAGFGEFGGLLGSKFGDIMKMINVNVVALTFIMQSGLQRMIANMKANDNTQGFIINISSIAGHITTRGISGPYCGTKHYVRALTEGVRKEIAENKDKIKQNIHIGMVSPGFVKTEFAIRATKGNQQMVDGLMKQYGFLYSKDIASNVVYMMSQGPHANICDIIIRPREQAM